MITNKSKTLFLEPEGQKYRVLNHHKETLLTHTNQEFPLLTKEIGDIMLHDFDISYYSKDELNYRSSYVYCMLSTLTTFHQGFKCPDANCHIDHYAISINVQHDIQWDPVYRLQPDPHLMMAQMNAIIPLKNFLGSEYNDYPLNYAPTYDEIENPEWSTCFISQGIVDIFTQKVNSFNRAQRFAVMLVNNEFENTSLSLAILLIAGIITPKEYFTAVMVFTKLKKSDKLTKKELEGYKHFLPRIENVFSFLNAKSLGEFL